MNAASLWLLLVISGPNVHDVLRIPQLVSEEQCAAIGKAMAPKAYVCVPENKDGIRNNVRKNT